MRRSLLLSWLGLLLCLGWIRPALARTDLRRRPLALKPSPPKTSRVPGTASAFAGDYQKRRLTDARSIQCYLLCGSRVFQQAMRNTLTNVLLYMAKDIDIGLGEKGNLLAAIATGYFFTQVPGGALADVFGPKTVMVTTLTLSALCCLAVPFAATYGGLTGIWWTMCLMGAVQGPMFPTSSVVLKRWMPTRGDEKAWGTSMLDIGISLGSLAIIPTVTSLAEALGWKGTFTVVGLASLAFCALYIWLGADSPADCWYISGREKAYLERQLIGSNAKRPSSKRKNWPTRTESGMKTPWIGLPWAMARHPGLWSIFVCHMAFNFGAYYLTNWSPQYYQQALGIEQKNAKIHLMCPHMTNLLVRLANPSLLAAVARAGLPLLASRKLFTAVGYTAAALCLAPVYSLRQYNPWISTALFSIANACFGLAPTGFKSNYLDVTENFVGIVAGYGNTLGTFASIVGPKITAATLVHTNNNWYAVLGTVCAVNLLAAANFVGNAVVTPIETII